MRAELEKHSIDTPMHSQHKMESSCFKDNDFINMRETVYIFAQLNLCRLDLYSTQHPASLMGKRALRFIMMHSESSKVQSIIKEVGGNLTLIVSFPNAVNILKHLEVF